MAAAGWAGVALALRAPEDDALRSRIATHLHPLAGRPVLWHVLRAMMAHRTPPQRLALVAAEPLDRAVVGEVPADLIAPDDTAWIAGLPPDVEQVVIVDAAAAALEKSLYALLKRRGAGRLRASDGTTLAVSVPRAAALAAPFAEILATSDDLPPLRTPGDELFLIRDRASLARAAAIVRDRTIARMMRDGVTFLLPATVVVDVDVRIGRDSIIYPGVMLEGSTTIGTESVIGPGCRVVDSRIGNGVELKGWNYVVRTSIRNRAVLDPYVRRGFD